MRMKWLHLSDIHFTFKNYNSHAMREDFLKRISLLSQNEPFTHLFLTGDILFKNCEADVETVAFIKKLMEIMQLTADKVYIVPGNHDHDRAVVIARLATLPNQDDVTIDDLDQSFRVQLLGAFSKFDAVCQEIFGDSYHAADGNPHSVCTADSISVIKLNTAWLDTDSAAAPPLRIGSRQLQLLLTAADTDLQKTVNIAMGHHPLQALSVAEQSRVLKLFQQHNIGIYFCGHSHQANINVYRSHDVIEIIAPGGFVDNENYSIGGYVWGVIDTDTNFYKAEIYNWNNGKWGIDSTLPETDDHGIFYFNTTHFPNSTDVVAVDCKTMGKHISIGQLKQSLGIDNFDIHTYCGPHGDPTGYSQDTITDFSDTILHLSEKGKTVHLYPLAPIPMLLSLGFNLQKDTKLYIHQYERDADKWVYAESSDGISITHSACLNDNQILAVIISTSFSIAPASVSEALSGKEYDCLTFKSSRIGPGYPLYHDDVDAVVQEITSVLNPLANNYSEVHVFAAIPAGLAVELGRCLLKSVYKNVFTYQFQNGHYMQDIVINQVIAQEPRVRTPSFSLDLSNIVYIPILGRVPCGPLKEAITDSDKCFPMPESVLPNGDYYILQASGDSMIDAGIEDGDDILIRQQNVANEGDIVVAYIDGETTIKRIHFDDANQLVVLLPENDQYEPQAYKQIEIQGVAVKVMKSL